MPWEYGPIAAGASVTEFNPRFDIAYATTKLTRCRHDGQGFVRLGRHGSGSSNSSKPYLISDV